MVLNLVDILREVFTKPENLKIKPDLIIGRNLENLLMLIKTVRTLFNIIHLTYLINYYIALNKC